MENFEYKKIELEVRRFNLTPIQLQAVQAVDTRMDLIGYLK